MWSLRRTSIVVAAGLCGAALSPASALSAGGHPASTPGGGSTVGTRWVARYSAPGNTADYAHTLDVSPDGSMVFVTGHGTSVFVTGYTSRRNRGSNYATVAYDASTGVSRGWPDTRGRGSNYDIASDICVSPDGSNVFVTGYSTGATTGADYATVAWGIA
jgi:hypothetical protein